MNLYAVCLVFCVPLFITVGGQILDFDCRRSGVSCQNNGTCDVTTRACSCPANGTYNYICQNASTSCDQDHYGESCRMERVHVNCTSTKMFVNINPHGNFGGVIYVLGQDSNTACALTEGTGGQGLEDYIGPNKDDLVGWRIELKHKGTTCGDALESNVTNIETFTREFYAQYNSLLKSSADQRFTIKCNANQNGVEVSSEVEEINNENNVTNVNVEGNVEIIQFELKAQDGTDLPSEVILGDEIRLVFTLTADSGFTSFKLEDCEADNSAEGDDKRSIDFLSDSCPSDNGTALFLDKPTRVNGPPVVITMRMTAFLFRGPSAKVVFKCGVKLCQADDDAADCAMPACAGITTSESDQTGTGTTNGDNSTSENTDNGDNSTSQNTANGDNSTSENTANGDNSTSQNTTNGNNSTSENTANGDNSTSENTTNGDNSTSQNTTNGDNSSSQNSTNGDNSGSSGGNKRRKRDTETLAQVSTTINVVDPNARKEEAIQEKKKEVDCMLESEVLALIVVLAVGVATLILVVIVLGYQLKTHKWKKAPPMPAMNQHPIQTFSIPRLDISTSTKSHPRVV